jgi:hypothetical protein
MERNFKGHRDVVTTVDFNPNMKQIGRFIALPLLQLTCAKITHSLHYFPYF